MSKPEEVRRVSRLTTALDLIGVALLVAFAFFVWPPAALGVAGVFALVASWRATA